MYNLSREEQESLMEEMYMRGSSYEEIGDMLGISKEAARGRIRNRDYYTPNSRTIISSQISFFEGSNDSQMPDDIKIKLMKEAGIDPNEWDITRARISSWDMAGREEPAKSINLTVAPKKLEDKVKYEQIAEDIRKIEPIKLNSSKETGISNLVIPLFDLHFGTSSLEHYKQVLTNIVTHIQENRFNNIVIIAGGDILNEDNYNGTTSSGTQIGATNMQQAWLECFQFFSTIIQEAYSKSNILKVLYVPGNHDTFSGHTVLLALERYFEDSDIEFDTTQEVFKAILLDKVMICATHGHKSNIKKLPLIFATSFPQYWSEANARECFTGHFHHEVVSQDVGIVLRQMPTRNVVDQWSKDNGFTTSQEKMFIVEYNKDELKSIIVV